MKTEITESTFANVRYLALLMVNRHPGELHSHIPGYCDQMLSNSWRMGREIVDNLRACEPGMVPDACFDNDLDLLARYSAWCQLYGEATAAGRTIPWTCAPDATVEDILAEIGEPEDFAALMSLNWDINT